MITRTTVWPTRDQYTFVSPEVAIAGCAITPGFMKTPHQSSSGKTPWGGLLQPLDDEEIRQQPRVAVGVLLCVRRDEEIRDPLDICRIGREQFFQTSRLPVSTSMRRSSRAVWGRLKRFPS